MTLYVMCHIAFLVEIVMIIITLSGGYTQATFEPWHRTTLIICGIAGALGSIAFLVHIKVNYFQKDRLIKLPDKKSVLALWEVPKLILSLLMVLIALPPGYLDHLITTFF